MSGRDSAKALAVMLMLLLFTAAAVAQEEGTEPSPGVPAVPAPEPEPTPTPEPAFPIGNLSVSQYRIFIERSSTSQEAINPPEGSVFTVAEGDDLGSSFDATNMFAPGGNTFNATFLLLIQFAGGGEVYNTTNTTLPPQATGSTTLQLPITSTAPSGDHQLIIAAFSDDEQHADAKFFTLRLRREGEGDAYEPDNTPEEANPITTDNTPQKHELSPAGDVDWIRFAAETGKEYAIRTLDLANGADTVIELYNSSMTLLAQNDDFSEQDESGLASKISFAPQEAGTHFVKVRHFSSTGTGSYSIRIGLSEAFVQEQTRQQLASMFSSGDFTRIGEGMSICVSVPYLKQRFWYSVQKSGGVSVATAEQFCSGLSSQDFSFSFTSYDSFVKQHAKQDAASFIRGGRKSEKDYYVLPSKFVQAGGGISSDNEFRNRYCSFLAAGLNAVERLALGLNDCSNAGETIARGFDGRTTKISDISNLSNATGIVFEKTASGSIDFGGSIIDLSDAIGLEAFITIGTGMISIDTNALPAFRGKPATLTMRNLGFDIAPHILKDGKPCSNACSNVHYSSGVLRFDVEHFTTYTVEEARQPRIKIASARITEEYITPNDDVQALVRVSNTRKAELKNVHVTIAIQELGLRKRVGPLDIASEEDETRIVQMALAEENVPPDEYYVRITTSNDDFRRVKYRTVVVQ